jgi:pimeloyl-ACP methyl ester carboxylesterase
MLPLPRRARRALVGAGRARRAPVRAGRARRLLVGAGVVAATLVAGPAAASARPSAPVPHLSWTDCGGGFQCATAKVPRDYARPAGRTIRLALIRLPATDRARRIGSLFVNFGGPGGEAVSTIRAAGRELFGSLNDRFDIVGFDPRGVGQSTPSIDCKVNQETLGVYAQPFTTPLNLDVGSLVRRDVRYISRCLALNRGILPYVSTANVARDMDLLRAAVGDRKLNYLGYSYGTFLGATYESLFPRRYRALVLDGALDADQYINEPLDSLRAQTAGFERALGRFFQACAANQAACRGFGGQDPWSAFDELAERLDAQPLRAGGPDPRPVDGDDLRAAAIQAVYAKQLWPVLAAALAQAQAGDGTLVRRLVDVFYGRNPDGTYDPLLDRYFTISALEQRYPRDIATYLDAGEDSWQSFDHFWFNSGYVELAWGLYPVRPRGAFYGPFRAARRATPTLVVATTYDPATPYRGSVQLVRDLGNARLLTMRGDGHTAYGGNSRCIDRAVDAYLEDLVVPARGTTCRQEVPFAAPQATAARARAAAATGRADQALRLLAPRVKPIVG